MKKTNKLFVAMLVAGSFAMLLGSCKKNETEAEVVIGLPDYEEEVGDRAYIDVDGHFKWNANDQVAIYNLAMDGEGEKAIYETTAAAEGKTSARFHYVSGQRLSAKMDAGYFVFYPVEKVQENLQAGNYQTFEVEDQQDYTVVADAATIDPKGMGMACTLNKLGGSFKLKHIFGALKLQLKGTGKVTRIEVIDEQFNLCGAVSMKLHEVNMETFSDLQADFIADPDPYANPTWVSAWEAYKQTLDYSIDNPAGKMMTLNCDNVQLNNSQYTNFLIGLRPGALKYGFTVKVYRQGSADPVVLDYTGANNPHYGIKAGIIKKFQHTL